MPECPICNSAARLWRTVHRDDADWHIHRCAACGHGFVHPRPTLAFLMDYYATSGHGERSGTQTLARVVGEEELHPNSTIDAERIVKVAAALQRVAAPRRLLDVGCGYGFFAKEAQRRGFEVTTLELASIERGIAAEMLGAAPLATSFEDLSALPESFSVILMSQILEHALDVHAWISKARNLLVPGGVLVVALPNFDGIYRRVLGARDPFVVPPAHLNYFTPLSLRTLLEGHGLTVERLDWISRIPGDALERRFGAMAPVAAAFAHGAFAVLNALHLGVILNAYGLRR